MTDPLLFGNIDHRPELVMPLPLTSAREIKVSPAFRHSHSPEQTAEMLADKFDQRPIKRFYPHDDEAVTDPLAIHLLMEKP